MRILVILLLFPFSLWADDGLTAVKNFGSNPGELRMYYHVPVPVRERAPLVVVLHGCTETAASCARLTGWNKFADENGFFVLYPEQKMLNNGQTCFNWFYSGDQHRDKGEPGSIMEMIRYMEANFSIDSTRIFASGLSAGAAMGAVLMSVYPDVFSAGALFAGGPYKSATDVFESIDAMNGNVQKTPQEWGDLVRAEYPGYTGKYPRAMIVQGLADGVVNARNADALAAQWTNVQGCDFIPDQYDSAFNQYSSIHRTVYANVAGEIAVLVFSISEMGHAFPLDTGTCSCQGGKTGMWGKQTGFSGVYEAMKFFGIASFDSLCSACSPSLLLTTFFPVPAKNERMNLPDTIEVNGIVVNSSQGYCGVICMGGEAKIRLLEPVPGYSDSCLYLVVPCLSAGIKPGTTVHVKATAFTGEETECYFRSINSTINSDGLPFYKLSEAEAAKMNMQVKDK
jgi:poly(hydroxyalkanoate) depolymerase family esterase